MKQLPNSENLVVKRCRDPVVIVHKERLGESDSPDQASAWFCSANRRTRRSFCVPRRFRLGINFLYYFSICHKLYAIY